MMCFEVNLDFVNKFNSFEAVKSNFYSLKPNPNVRIVGKEILQHYFLLILK